MTSDVKPAHPPVSPPTADDSGGGWVPILHAHSTREDFHALLDDLVRASLVDVLAQLGAQRVNQRDQLAALVASEPWIREMATRQLTSAWTDLQRDTASDAVH